MRFSENLTAQLAFVINGSQISFLFEVFHACRLAFHQFLVYFKPYFEKSGNFLIRKEILSFFVMNFKQEFLQEIRKKEFLNHLVGTFAGNISSQDDSGGFDNSSSGNRNANYLTYTKSVTLLIFVLIIPIPACAFPPLPVRSEMDCVLPI